MRPVKTLLFALVCLLLSLPLLAQKGEGPLDPSQPTGITPQEVIQKFAAKETQFKEARDNYTYQQSIVVETLDGRTVTGKFEIKWDVLFDDKGRRIENVTYAPQSTLEEGGVRMGPRDYEDIRNVLPFVMTSAEIPLYDIRYLGRQRQDELTTYAFEVRPKQIQPGKRYFDGRIWVDDQDFQIVRTSGRTVPDIRPRKKGKFGDEDLFPAFTTWREQVDGQYWFPTFTRADDTLHFSTGDIHIREIIKYTNYKRFGSKVRITYEGQELPPAQQPKGGDSGQQPPK